MAQQAVITLTAITPSILPPKRVLNLSPECLNVPIGRSSKKASKGLLPAEENAWFDNPVMSRFHAELIFRIEDMSIMIQDSQSMHGTQVNNTLLPANAPQAVTSGDILCFGVEVRSGTETFAPSKFRIDYEVLPLEVKNCGRMLYPKIKQGFPNSKEPAPAISNSGTKHLKIPILPLMSISPTMTHSFADSKTKYRETQQDLSDSKKPVSAIVDSRTKLSKIKRGLSGFINGTRVSAIADTGSAQNIISAAYLSSIKFPIEHTSSIFRLGNSKTIQSIGTVRLLWSFSEDPIKKYDLLFHVLPTCIYDVILGSDFLTATETLSKYRSRLTKCLFSVARVFKFGFLGNSCHRLRGFINDKHEILAVPDTGAERNVMDYWYAKSHGFYINTGLGTKNVLQFADGSCQETVGQVTTHWTFASGKKALLTFEVLEDCASNVVIGEDFIYEHNIFEEHKSSLQMLPSDIDSYELAPFDFVTSWQQKYLNVKSRLIKGNSAGSIDSENERLRREEWNYKYNFGSFATTEEKQAETNRRKTYQEKQELIALERNPGHVPRIPSIQSAASTSLQSNRTVSATARNFSRPLE